MRHAALTFAMPLLALGLAGSASAQQAAPACPDGTAQCVDDPTIEATQDKPETRGFSIAKRRPGTPATVAAPVAAQPAPSAPAPRPVASSGGGSGGGGSPAPRQIRPTFDPDGNVNVPAFDLPPSAFLSPQALAAQKARARYPVSTPSNDADILQVRRGIEALLAPQVARMRELYPVDVVDQTIAGVRTKVVTPKGRPVDKSRVLINLHGGGFSMCAEACALLESVPIAGAGQFKVVTVNYRMGPEAQHPAALEDVSAVYRELLKSYKPRQIGIYGCSAGGALSGQIGAWLPAHRLPQPGALGIFGAGGVRFMAGDSAWIAGNVDGSFPPPNLARGDMTRGYFARADLNDAVISPATHPEVIAKFPPTLLITGTRAMDMSPAVVTNSALLKAGVRSTLVVGEGMGHCYIYQPDLPEAKDARDVIVRFFRENLK